MPHRRFILQQGLIALGRSQVNDWKYIVGQTDQEAFVVIGVAHQAFGGTSFPLVKSR